MTQARLDLSTQTMSRSSADVTLRAQVLTLCSRAADAWHANEAGNGQAWFWRGETKRCRQRLRRRGRVESSRHDAVVGGGPRTRSIAERCRRAWGPRFQLTSVTHGCPSSPLERLNHFGVWIHCDRATAPYAVMFGAIAIAFADACNCGRHVVAWCLTNQVLTQQDLGTSALAALRDAQRRATSR